MALWESKTLTLNSPSGALCRSVFAATKPDGPAPGAIVRLTDGLINMYEGAYQ